MMWTCPDFVDSLLLGDLGPGVQGREPLIGVEGPKAPAGCGAAPHSLPEFVGRFEFAFLLSSLLSGEEGSFWEVVLPGPPRPMAL